MNRRRATRASGALRPLQLLRPLLLSLLTAVGVFAPALASPATPRPGHAAVASAHPLATAAGLEVLRAGGNAFDAAVAISAALAVVEPTGSGLSGGGFYLLHRARDGREVVLDARETAPSAASRDMFLDSKGEPVRGLSIDSALGAAIPGEPAGMAELARKYGRLPVAVSLAPAIHLADAGFALTPRLHDALQMNLDKFAQNAEVARNFLRNGAVPPLGTIIRQPELAATLRWLAEHGLMSFYRGEFAARLVAGQRALGGNWTEADLAAYKLIERAPVVGYYHGARVVSAPPPSSGGVLLLETLNVLAQFDLEHLTPVDRKHLLIEAERRAHRDRAVYLGDPDFVSVPVARLTHPEYAAGLAASIRIDRATVSDNLPGVTSSGEPGPETTHFSVLDAAGNRVAATITLNFSFGSGLMIPGTGLFLNNEMDDFSIKPGVPNGYGLVGAEANAIAPGKRPLSSTTPAFVEKDGRLMITGSPGGSLIPGMVIAATLDFLDGRGATEIVGAPRIHHQYLPDVLRAEPGALSEADVVALKSRGHRVEVAGRRWGNEQTIVWDERSGEVRAASDPRGDGAGQVE